MNREIKWVIAYVIHLIPITLLIILSVFHLDTSLFIYVILFAWTFAGVIITGKFDTGTFEVTAGNVKIFENRLK
ncbi:hypothetical protein [Vallitalea maricola]|uniref:Uncharacterized protein n=1 Tax=Vallitalea maricola TaxID=3074433 RepID=A0ACB5UM14_9FIRM|nr:hypothetical protein AN2V17_21850 [Vallitalea sp. AN17-2]